jgi:hypothetical protein
MFVCCLFARCFLLIAMHDWAGATPKTWLAARAQGPAQIYFENLANRNANKAKMECGDLNVKILCVGNSSTQDVACGAMSPQARIVLAEMPMVQQSPIDEQIREYLQQERIDGPAAGRPWSFSG